MSTPSMVTNLAGMPLFAVCCVGILVGLGNYALMRKSLVHYGS